MKILKYIVYIFLVLVILYSSWVSYPSMQQDKKEPKDKKLSTPVIINAGQNSGNGNLVGMQVSISGIDYSTEHRFYDKLETLMQHAKYNGFLNHQTTVLFPEHIGTFLVLNGEKPSAYLADDYKKAISSMKLSNIINYYLNYFNSSSGTKDIETLLKIKAEAVRDTYYKVFSKLAKIYGVYIVAGTIVLPSPIVRDGKIYIREGKLENVSFVFSPKGDVMELHSAKKTLSKVESYLLNSDKSKTTPLIQSNLLPYTSAIIISHDTLGNSSYLLNTEKIPDAILSPSSILKEEDLAWYFSKNLSKFNPNIKEVLKEKNSPTDLWLTYSLPQWIFFSGARIGLQVFLNGHIIGLNLSGYSYYIMGTEIDVVPSREDSAIINVWN
ncbi:MAG: hypothetical protein H7A23_06820 [Leptospiraceae bacterium]|nr:hypothetical protein [Leptospiraceae bacterium]